MGGKGSRWSYCVIQGNLLNAKRILHTLGTGYPELAETVMENGQELPFWICEQRSSIHTHEHTRKSDEITSTIPVPMNGPIGTSNMHTDIIKQEKYINPASQRKKPCPIVIE